MTWYVFTAIIVANVLFLFGIYLVMRQRFADRSRKVDAHFRSREREVSMKSFAEGCETRDREVKRREDKVTILAERLIAAGLPIG